jgi:hypothetical protein
MVDAGVVVVDVVVVVEECEAGVADFTAAGGDVALSSEAGPTRPL